MSSSVVPFSSCPQSLPASESFPMSQLFAWGGQSTGVSALASVLPQNTQDWSPSEWTGWISLQSMGLTRVKTRFVWLWVLSSGLCFDFRPQNFELHSLGRRKVVSQQLSYSAGWWRLALWSWSGQPGLGQRVVFLGLEEEETSGSGTDRLWKSSPGAQGGEALVGDIKKLIVPVRHRKCVGGYGNM